MRHHIIPKACCGYATQIIHNKLSRRSQCLSLLGIIAALGGLGLASILAFPAKSLAAMQASMTASTAQVQTAYGQMPLHFEAHQGQIHGQVQFLSRGQGYNLFLTATEAVLTLRVPGTARPQQPTGSAAIAPDAASPRVQPAVLRMQFVGANPAAHMVGLEKLPGKVHYFLGNDPTHWRTDIPTYAKVKGQGVYPGVDVVYYGNQRQLEYDFVVAPGADPNAIILAFEGTDALEVDSKNHLVLHTTGGQVRLHRPRVYQEVDGIRQEVAASYILKGKNEVAFQLGAYNTAQALVIDPVLSYFTYLGGSGFENFGQQAAGIAVDTAGNAYVTGETDSIDFPTTQDGFQPIFSGGSDAFVAKLNATGTALVYSTYLGGTGGDIGRHIVVDTAGNVYVTGYTNSSDFPITQGAFDTSCGTDGFCNNAQSDVFVAKLNADGTALTYSTYLGNSRHDYGLGIAVDAAGNAYVTGGTEGFFPITSGAYQSTFRGHVDAFVTKLNAVGTALVYSTYLSGVGFDISTATDWGQGIAVDAAGNAYVTGFTGSDSFPITQGVFQPAYEVCPSPMKHSQNLRRRLNHV